MVESALRHVQLLEKYDFDLIKVALKASSVLSTVAAYRLFSEKAIIPFTWGLLKRAHWCGAR